MKSKRRRQGQCRERESDRMGMSWRARSHSECRCRLRGMKDAHWKIRNRCLTDTQRDCLSAIVATGKTEALQSWLWHASLRAGASYSLSQPANQCAHRRDVCVQRFMGARVPQCLATAALQLATVDYKRLLPHTLTPSLSLSLLLFLHLLQSQFANGCSNLVIYCCRRYASSKMH